MLEPDIQIEKFDNLKKKFKSNLKIKKLDSGYKIVSIVKNEITCEDDQKLAPYNSIVYNKEDKIMSIFPIVNTNEILFLLEKNFKGFIVRSGIPFSLFWDNSIGAFGSWQIHSQNQVGEDACFNKNKIKDQFRKFTEDNFNIFNILNKKYVYHVKLDNNDFKSIQISFVYEILIEKDKDVIKLIDMTEKSFIMEHIGNKNLVIPNYLSYEQCLEKINQYSYLMMSPEEKGLQLIAPNGSLCKIYNKTYFYKKIINSIYPQNFYIFLQLKSINKITWATHDNKLLKEMYKHLQNLNDLFFSTILELYLNIYIFKNQNIDSVNMIYQFILKEVHQQYLFNIKNKKKIGKIDIKHVFNKKSIEDQMYLICSVLK